MARIPNSNEIKQFFHCANCMKDLPSGKSPREWAQLEAGFTELGVQVWCKRCECNIVHIDFQGQCHPANMTRKRPETGTKH